jgi:hypothetical protein
VGCYNRGGMDSTRARFRPCDLLIAALLLALVSALGVQAGGILAPADAANPALGNLPDTLRFIYGIPDQRSFPTAYRITPLNVGSSHPLTWTVTAEGSWFAVAPAAGATYASFWITPTTFSTGTVWTYAGAVTVTVTAPAGTAGSPHRIDLSLRVMDDPFTPVYLPLLMRDLPPYPDDTYYGNQWALEKVGAPQAWAQSKGRGILVAVLDTGADLDHPDLASKVRTDIDWDFVDDDAVAEDSHGHGTHVSGIVAAATDNGLGVAGMGWEATLLPLRVVGPGGADSVTLADAIYYAVDHGAGVINMSVGSQTVCPTIVQDAATYAHAQNVVLVAAAGNDGANAQSFPANCYYVLGVAATTSGDTRASFSNYGAHVAVAAPGSDIYSTAMGGGYGARSGTSMAAPLVAGLAALVRARYPDYTATEVVSAILDNAVDLGAASWDPYYGCGRIDAARALAVGAHDGAFPVCLWGQPGQWDESGEDLGAASDAPFVPGEVIVAFRPGAGDRAVQAVLRRGAGAEHLSRLDVWRLRVSVGQERAILAQLLADPAVAHAELNYLVFVR